MNARVERVRALIEAPLLVTKPVNVGYLTGLASTNAGLLVEPDRLRLFTDFRYGEKARTLGLEVVEVPRNLFAGLPEHLPGRVEFEAEHMTYAAWAALSAGGIELVPRHELVEGVRSVKEPGELEAISRASAITNGCFERLAEEPFVGRTERELAWWIESLMHELGADGPACDVIVAAGANGASPHASSGDRTIEAGQTVVVDAAAKHGGYCSDCTRTFATGELPAELARSYEVCLRGQKAGLAAVRPGASGRDVDAVARAAIAGEELGGIRIEDLVVIGEDGPEVLTSFTREFVIVS